MLHDADEYLTNPALAKAPHKFKIGAGVRAMVNLFNEPPGRGPRVSVVDTPGTVHGVRFYPPIAPRYWVKFDDGTESNEIPESWIDFASGTAADV